MSQKRRNGKFVKTHGMRFHPAYAVWRGIKVRCDNPHNQFYKDYGGRGISYPKKWKEFTGFWEDMGGTYKEGLEIDRIDNNLSYSKTNCQWSTRKEQQNNRRMCVILKYKDTELNITQWSEYLNVPRSTLYSRHTRGWPVNKILKEYDNT